MADNSESENKGIYWYDINYFDDPVSGFCETNMAGSVCNLTLKTVILSLLSKY